MAIFKNMDYAAAKKRAFWLLSRKSYHSEVLLKKLIDKGATCEVANQVIKDCKRLGFLDDKQAILRELKRGYGPRAIEYKLHLSREEVRGCISKIMQKEKILELLPRLGPKEKAFRTLQRKGFDIDLLIEIFSFRD